VSAEPTTAAFFLRPLGRALAARGIALSSVLDRAGVPPSPPPDRIAFAKACEVWRRAAEAAADPALGVDVALAVQPGDYGVLEFAARSSATLRAAFRRLSRFHRLLNEGASVTLAAGGGVTRVCYEPPGALEAMPRPYLDCVLASWILTARQLADAPLTPSAVALPYEASGAPGAIFGPSVSFGAGRAELHFDDEVFDAPLPRGDDALGATLDRHAESVLGELAARAAWRRRTASAIELALADGAPKLEGIAERLGVPSRALRRHLEREGTSFAAVLDETRRGLAAELVGRPGLSLGEIAFLLGFSETSAFHRAYKRWTGRTPRSG
jgi:AraC-like DNA-binding protein